MSTSKSLTYSAVSNSKNVHVYAAICESRGQVPQIGIATFDTSFCEVQMSEFADSKTYDFLLSKLLLLDPHVILFPNTQLNEHLMTTLHENTGAQLIPIDRKYFSDEIGMNTIENFALKDDVPKIKILTNAQYFSLSCVGALFKFLNSSNEMFAHHSLKFTTCAAANTMLIDYTTARNLELVYNQTGNKNNGSLFNVLNYCCTKMGNRKLRTSVLQPSTDPTLISQVQQSIEELLSKRETLATIKDYLDNLGDVDSLIMFLVKKPSSRNNPKSLNLNIASCVELKKLCHSLIGLWKLQSNDLTCLNALYDMVPEEEVNKLYSKLDLVISDDVIFEKSAIGARNQKIFAIKPEIDGMLDVARQMYQESINDVYELSTDYSEAFHVEMQVVHERQGYRFSISKEFESMLDQSSIKFKNDDEKVNGTDLFVERKRKAKKITFTTLDLMKLNERINENVYEINLTSERVLKELINDLRENIDIWYKISSAIASLDYIYSMTKYSSISQTVRPQFSEVIAIKQAHHPIRKSLKYSSVPNDCYASKESRIQVISGSNMSGKSTYTKQIALLIIMCQIGCFVPCDLMYFPIFDCILTRIGNDDDLKTNSGSFCKEMRSLSYVFDKVSSNSLVIIDELGRGTSHIDAISITLATIERLVKTNCILFLITHIEELIEPLEQYPGILQVHFDVELSHGKPSYSYEIKEGASRSRFYGIDLAKEAALPEKLVNDAREIAESLYSTEKKLINIDESVNISKIKQCFYEMTRNACNQPTELTLALLKDYRRQYLEALGQI
eukprot:NODE_230_length_13723_cov_0.393570.p2 type:complete len:787 gc:universal NODE_230_length_13723_cov_0.393570:6935-9295(+)